MRSIIIYLPGKSREKYGSIFSRSKHADLQATKNLIAGLTKEVPDVGIICFGAKKYRSALESEVSSYTVFRGGYLELFSQLPAQQNIIMSPFLDVLSGDVVQLFHLLDTFDMCAAYRQSGRFGECQDIFASMNIHLGVVGVVRSEKVLDFFRSLPSRPGSIAHRITKHILSDGSLLFSPIRQNYNWQRKMPPLHQDTEANPVLLYLGH